MTTIKSDAAQAEPGIQRLLPFFVLKLLLETSC
jgi:hypothetical protein